MFSEISIPVFVAWNVFGAAILIFAHGSNTTGVLNNSDGWEFVNPFVVHKYNKVNWFGAFVVALIYNALCPVGAVSYWMYKLCTVGRK